MALPVPVSIGERLWGIPWGIPRDLLDLVDSRLIPTVFHVLINGRVARPNRVWSRDRIRSRVRVWSHVRSRVRVWSRVRSRVRVWSCVRLHVRVWSRVRSRVRVWSHVRSREARTGEGSRDGSRASFPRSRAFFSGSRGGIFVFTIWL